MLNCNFIHNSTNTPATVSGGDSRTSRPSTIHAVVDAVSRTGISPSFHLAGAVQHVTISDILLPSSLLLRNPSSLVSEFSAADYAQYLQQLRQNRDVVAQARLSSDGHHLSDEKVLAVPESGFSMWDACPAEVLFALHGAGCRFESCIMPITGTWGSDELTHLPFGDRHVLQSEIDKSNRHALRTRVLSHYAQYFSCCGRSPGLQQWSPYTPNRPRSSPASDVCASLRGDAGAHSHHSRQKSPATARANMQPRASTAKLFLRQAANLLWGGSEAASSQDASEASQSSPTSTSELEPQNTSRYSSASRSRTPPPAPLGSGAQPLSRSNASHVTLGRLLTSSVFGHRRNPTTPKRQLYSPTDVEDVSVVDSLCTFPLYSEVCRLGPDHPRCQRYQTQQRHLCAMAITEMRKLYCGVHVVDPSMPILVRRIRCVGLPTFVPQRALAPLRSASQCDEEDDDVPAVFVTMSVTLSHLPSVGSQSEVPAAAGVLLGRRDRFTVLLDAAGVHNEVAHGTLSFYRRAVTEPADPTRGHVGTSCVGWLGEALARGQVEPICIVDPSLRSSATSWSSGNTMRFPLYHGDVFGANTILPPNKGGSYNAGFFGAHLDLPFGAILQVERGHGSGISVGDGTFPPRLPSLRFVVVRPSFLRHQMFEERPVDALGLLGSSSAKAESMPDTDVPERTASPMGSDVEVAQSIILGCCTVSVSFVRDPPLPTLHRPSMLTRMNDTVATLAAASAHRLSSAAATGRFHSNDQLASEMDDLVCVFDAMMAHKIPHKDIRRLLSTVPVGLLQAAQCEHDVYCEALLAYSRDLLQQEDTADIGTLLANRPQPSFRNHAVTVLQMMFVHYAASARCNAPLSHAASVQMLRESVRGSSVGLGSIVASVRRSESMVVAEDSDEVDEQDAVAGTLYGVPSSAAEGVSTRPDARSHTAEASQEGNQPTESSASERYPRDPSSGREHVPPVLAAHEEATPPSFANSEMLCPATPPCKPSSALGSTSPPKPVIHSGSATPQFVLASQERQMVPHSDSAVTSLHAVPVASGTRLGNAAVPSAPYSKPSVSISTTSQSAATFASGINPNTGFPTYYSLHSFPSNGGAFTNLFPPQTTFCSASTSKAAEGRGVASEGPATPHTVPRSRRPPQQQPPNPQHSCGDGHEFVQKSATCSLISESEEGSSFDLTRAGCNTPIVVELAANDVLTATTAKVTLSKQCGNLISVDGKDDCFAFKHLGATSSEVSHLSEGIVVGMMMRGAGSGGAERCSQRQTITNNLQDIYSSAGPLDEGARREYPTVVRSLQFNDEREEVEEGCHNSAIIESHQIPILSEHVTSPASDAPPPSSIEVPAVVVIPRRSHTHPTAPYSSMSAAAASSSSFYVSSVLDAKVAVPSSSAPPLSFPLQGDPISSDLARPSPTRKLLDSISYDIARSVAANRDTSDSNSASRFTVTTSSTRRLVVSAPNTTTTTAPRDLLPTTHTLAAGGSSATERRRVGSGGVVGGLSSSDRPIVTRTSPPLQQRQQQRLLTHVSPAAPPTMLFPRVSDDGRDFACGASPITSAQRHTATRGSALKTTARTSPPQGARNRLSLHVESKAIDAVIEDLRSRRQRQAHIPVINTLPTTTSNTNLLTADHPPQPQRPAYFSSLNVNPTHPSDEDHPSAPNGNRLSDGGPSVAMPDQGNKHSSRRVAAARTTTYSSRAVEEYVREQAENAAERHLAHIASERDEGSRHRREAAEGSHRDNRDSVPKPTLPRGGDRGLLASSIEQYKRALQTADGTTTTSATAHAGSAVLHHPHQPVVPQPQQSSLRLASVVTPAAVARRAGSRLEMGRRYVPSWEACGPHINNGISTPFALAAGTNRNDNHDNDDDEVRSDCIPTTTSTLHQTRKDAKTPTHGMTGLSPRLRVTSRGPPVSNAVVTPRSPPTSARRLPILTSRTPSTQAKCPPQGATTGGARGTGTARKEGTNSSLLYDDFTLPARFLHRGTCEGRAEDDGTMMKALARARHIREAEYELAHIKASDRDFRLMVHPQRRNLTRPAAGNGLRDAHAMLQPLPPLTLPHPDHPMFQRNAAGFKRSRSEEQPLPAKLRTHNSYQRAKSKYGLTYFGDDESELGGDVNEEAPAAYQQYQQQQHFPSYPFAPAHGAPSQWCAIPNQHPAFAQVAPFYSPQQHWIPTTAQPAYHGPPYRMGAPFQQQQFVHPQQPPVMMVPATMYPSAFPNMGGGSGPYMMPMQCF